MAKLSAHGNEIGRIVFTAKTKAYMADGKILTNYGDGWKLTGKCKDGVSPEFAYESAVKYQAEFIANRPHLKAYREFLHEIAGQCKRHKLHLAVTMMPDDSDGVWSECCDGYSDNVSASCDEVSELCRLYRYAVMEQNEIKQQAKAA
jgi:hypothetical protein